ncbi:MAG: Tm-1-like ATP-binding domain-containing protein [Dehalococcoidales bacterium]|nr:Tm-1-like ATP-binding domain-containing protein [Dehalococcoidales bacterium]
MRSKKVILCIGTLDSKGPELQYVKNLINGKEHYRALVMDVGCLAEAFFSADITAEEVAAAAGATIEEVRAISEAGPATLIMTTGARKIVKELYESGAFSGVISIGGGTGSGIAAAVLQELPIGFPKFMLSSQKIVQAGIRKYVGTKDIVIMPSIADIAGLNRLTVDSLQKAVGAITGMMDTITQESYEKPLVFMTMTGLSTGCGLAVKSLLEDKGFEVGVFHTIGVGGETFEELIKSYPVKGVIELGMNEIGNELFGGLASAGPHRLEAAGEIGIPQIITPGCIDILNFLSPETLPERYSDRTICYHNPQATLPRVNADELRLIAGTISKKLNPARGKVKFLIPLRGFSSIDCEGNDFYDPVANNAFIGALEDSLRKDIEILKIDANINDSVFSESVANEFLKIL